MPGGQLVQQGAGSHRIVVIYDYYRFLQISSIEVSKEKQNVDPQCPPFVICLICVHPSSNDLNQVGIPRRGELYLL